MSKVSEAYKRWKEHCKIVQAATTVQRQEDPAEQKKRIKRAKKDYAYFVETYFPHYASDPCADFHVREANTLLNDENFFGVWEWPREHAKSVHADVISPMWLWINGELRGMVLCGKNEGDASNLLGDIQAEFEFNQRIIQDFGSQKKLGSWEDGEFEIADGILFKAYGRGQSARGIRNREKRPNYLVIDDLDDDEIVNNPKRVDKVVDWLLGSVYGAMDIRASRFLMVGNRIHPQSILANVVGDTGPGKVKRKGLHHSKVMATMDGTFTGKPSWYQKYTSEQLQRKFDRMGFTLANREYFHKCSVQGKNFKREWLKFDRIPSLKTMDHIVCYLDPSYKPKTTNDFKAWRCWGKKGIKLYCINAFVKQTTITEAVKWAYDLYEWAQKLGIIIDFYMEEVFLQDMFYDDFELEAKVRGYYLPVRGDTRKKPEKLSRILTMVPLYERGIITFDIKQKNSEHMIVGNDQLLAIEKGSSLPDDSPDADEGAIWILQNRGRQEAFTGKTGKRKRPNGW